MTAKHNKLVRDKILEIITANGGVVTSRILADDREFLKELCNKLIEEAREVAADPSIDELADSLEVLHAIAGQLGYSMEDIEKVRIKKAELRGGFNDRIYLINSEG